MTKDNQIKRWLARAKETKGAGLIITAQGAMTYVVPNLTPELVAYAKRPGCEGINLSTGKRYPLIDGLRLDIKPANLQEAVAWFVHCFDVGATYPLANISKAISDLTNQPYYMLVINEDDFSVHELGGWKGFKQALRTMYMADGDMLFMDLMLMERHWKPMIANAA